MGKITHGLYHHVSYTTWDKMMQRCYNKNNKQAKIYRRRGILVCERWKEVKYFIEDMGERPDGYSLDRIDNDKGYYKENCRWVPNKGFEQANNRSTNVFYSFDGLTMTGAQWARFLNISPRMQNLFKTRLSRGWDFAKAACTAYSFVFKERKKNKQVMSLTQAKLIQKRGRNARP